MRANDSEPYTQNAKRTAEGANHREECSGREPEEQHAEGSEEPERWIGSRGGSHRGCDGLIVTSRSVRRDGRIHSRRLLR